LYSACNSLVACRVINDYLRVHIHHIINFLSFGHLIGIYKKEFHKEADEKGEEADLFIRAAPCFYLLFEINML
jgi:hypothetical protein